MKTYGLKFGSGNSANYTGLSPTFVIFAAGGLTAVIGPGVTETPALSGLYQFQYGPTMSIIFKVDGGAALSDSDRYIYGALDPIQAVDEKVGTLDDSFGTTATDPTTVLGYLKRNQEFEEGNANFDKTTAIWDVFSRGSSVQLMSKTLSNTVSAANKS